jgi:hypothetical protein
MKSCILKHPEKLCTGDGVHNQKNAPVHSALSLRGFLARNCMTFITVHHPYPSDLALCDFLPVSKTQYNTQGKIFYDFVSLKEKSWIMLAEIKAWDFIDAPNNGTVTEFTYQFVRELL